jgi:hypothetical protein
LVSASRVTPSLIRLDLSGCGLRDDAASSLSSLLAHQPALTWLSLARNHLTAKGARLLFTALQSNCTLTHLSLAHNRMAHVSAEDAECASEEGEEEGPVASSPPLDCLHGTAASQRGSCPSSSLLAAAVFRCFAVQGGLESLDLRCCRVSDAVVCSLLAGMALSLQRPSASAVPPQQRATDGGLVHRSRLAVLRLSGNHLTAEVGRVLLSFLRLRPPLQRVDLRCTQVTFHHLRLIAGQCERLRASREEAEPRRLRRVIGRLQRDAVAFKVAQREREEVRERLAVVQRRVDDLEGSTVKLIRGHRVECQRLQDMLEGERLLARQSREVFEAQWKERMASEAVHGVRVQELAAQLEKEHGVRVAMEQRLQEVQRGLEEVVKERPARVEAGKRRLQEQQRENERLQVQVTHMRREHSRIQQAVATHQPVPHLLVYTQHLRAWYEWERRQRLSDAAAATSTLPSQPQRSTEHT